MGKVFDLFKAVIEGNVIAIEEFIKSGLSVNTKSEDGKTLLMAAAASGEKQAVKKLIQLGANIHATDPRGISAQMIALHFGHQEVVSILVSKEIEE